MRVFASDQHRLHHAPELHLGRLELSTECPQRAEQIREALEQYGHQFAAPDALDHDLLGRVHAADYLEFLATAWTRWCDAVSADAPAMGIFWPAGQRDALRPDNIVGQLGYYSLGADCSIVAGTWLAASASAALAQSAADFVVAEQKPAYALCRPPGHHASASQFGGYCYLNNSALAAQRLRDSGYARVAIIDLDYHHGNGTQSIFFARDDVLCVSIHADPRDEFPWFWGHASERGDGAGHGYNLNLPLPTGAGAEQVQAALGSAIGALQRAGCEALVIALGVDTYVDDPLGTFTLTTDDYRHLATPLAALALPTVIVQEGGYAVGPIGDNVAAFLSPFDA